MVYQISKYLTFLLHSTNQHGVHSPFVYDLVTKCFYDKQQYPAYKILETHRNLLLSDTASITVTDYGAGSRVFKSDQRAVSEIAKNAGISVKRQQLLFRLAQYFKPTQVLELGTSLGMGTMALALGAPSVKIFSVEGCSATSATAKRYFKEFGIKNSTCSTQTFETFFQQNKTENFDFVYIDGNHSKEATLNYFKILLKHIHNDTMLLFDDIYWSTQMTEAWQEIIAQPTVTVSIDTFQWGMVFFRKEQPKEHFVIRT